MSEDFRIAWQSRVGNSYGGHGEFVFPTREKCEEACRQLDMEWQDIRHWVEDRSSAQPSKDGAPGGGADER